MDQFTSLIENSKQAIRFWWLMLIVGIVLIGAAVVIFLYPAQSYMGMAVIFGWLMFLSGVLEIVVVAANKHFVTGRGWMLVGGILQAVLGIILIFNIALSAAALPVVLGFWLLMRGFSTVGLGSDMRALRVSGAGWTIISGTLLLLCAVWILLQPLVFGTTVVVVWVGISLLFAGIATCTLSMQLRQAHHCLEE